MIARTIREALAAYAVAPQTVSREAASSAASRVERPLTAPSAMTQTSGVPYVEKPPRDTFVQGPSDRIDGTQSWGRTRLAFPLACVSVAAPPVFCIAGAAQASVRFGFRLPMFAVYASLGIFVATSLLLVGVAFLERWESRIPSISNFDSEFFALPPRPDCRP